MSDTQKAADFTDTWDPVRKNIDTYIRNLRDGHEAYAEARLRGIGWVKPVRCAECRHAQMWWSHGIGRLECDAWSHMRSVPVDPNDYCSRGELREP